MFFLLLVSFLGTNGTMYYILFKHRFDRKSSVSLHAAIDNHSHSIFATGHFIGGMAFLYFAYEYFYLENESVFLWILACLGVLAEQAQAFIPDRRGFGKIHKIAATSMSGFILLIVLAAPLIIKLGTGWLIAYIGLIVLLCISGIYAIFNRHNLYKTQMLFFSAFHIFMLILLYGTVY